MNNNIVCAGSAEIENPDDLQVGKYMNQTVNELGDYEDGNVITIVKITKCYVWWYMEEGLGTTPIKKCKLQSKSHFFINNCPWYFISTQYMKFLGNHIKNADQEPTWNNVFN